MICSNQRFSQWIVFCFLFTQVVGENSKESVIRCRVKPVFLQLADGNCTNLLWKKDSQNLAKFKNGKFTPYFGFENRAEVFPNGTLKLAMINNNDTGLYLLEVFNKEGINILRESIHLHTQVSQPEKNSTCVMPGEAALVCGVEEGDSVYFHWNEVPSKNTNHQETVLIDLICTVAVEKRIRSVTAENISVPVYGALGHSVYLHFNTTLNSSVHVEWKQGDNCIEAVSQPVVHSTCLSHGKVLLVCTVYKGDNVSFNWSLDGVPLNTSLAYFSDEEYVVILKKHVSGNLVCIATNQVSTNQSDSVITNCSEPVSKPVVHSTCLSHGEVLLVCTVDKGDNASFNWSLDGVPLNTSLANFSDKEHIVILKKNVTGDLVCIAKNQINDEKSDSVKSNCSGSEPKINPTSTPNLETQFHCTLENGTVIELSGGKEGEAFQFLINKSMIITKYTHGIAFCSLQTCSSNCSGNLTTEPGDASNAEDADILKYVLGGSALLVIVMLSFTLLCMCKNKKRKENAHSVITQNRSDEQHVSLSTMIPETASTAIQDDQLYTQVVNKGGKKKSKCKPKEDSELVYAQVVIKEDKKKPIHDESVVYDEVKGKDKNNQQQDDSVVYAAINKRRNI